ncbi:hypothetical protein ACHAXT_006301 [Thalassiosira profunda]
MPSPSASSDEESDGSSSVDAPVSTNKEGFAFDGNVYQTYQEMVAAKRERNRRVLQKSADEISSVLGRDLGSKSSCNDEPSKPKKRRRSAPKRAPAAPLRRNPSRSARSAASSISSQSNHSSFNNLSGRKPVRRPSSVSFPARAEDGSVGDASVFSTGDQLVDAPTNVPRVIDVTELSPKAAMVKDMSAELEHILLHGGRVQARESVRDAFIRSDPVLGSGEESTTTKRATKNSNKRSRGKMEEGGKSTEAMGLVHPSDQALYDAIIYASAQTKSGPNKKYGDTGKGAPGRDGGMSLGSLCGAFAGDLSIPKEFLAAEEHAQESSHEKQHLGMPREPLPLNDPVRYNNMVREQHAYYTSIGPDRHWDEAFGDGIDPQTFVEECCKCTHSVEGDGASRLAEQFTSSLLQRCWDRAVHAASSTLTVDVAPSELSDGVDMNYVSPLRQQAAVNAILHREALITVDGLLDTILSKEDGVLNNQLPAKKKGRKAKATKSEQSNSVDWRHILKHLQAAAEGDTTSNEDRSHVVMNATALKALSMRLIERNGSGSHNKRHSRGC